MQSTQRSRPDTHLPCRPSVGGKSGCSGSDVMADTELMDALDVEQTRQTIQCSKDIAMLQFILPFSPKSGGKTSPRERPIIQEPPCRLKMLDYFHTRNTAEDKSPTGRPGEFRARRCTSPPARPIRLSDSRSRYRKSACVGNWTTGSSICRCKVCLMRLSSRCDLTRMSSLGKFEPRSSSGCPCSGGPLRFLGIFTALRSSLQDGDLYSLRSSTHPSAYDACLRRLLCRLARSSSRLRLMSLSRRIEQTAMEQSGTPAQSYAASQSLPSHDPAPFYHCLSPVQTW